MLSIKIWRHNYYIIKNEKEKLNAILVMVILSVHFELFL